MIRMKLFLLILMGTLLYQCAVQKRLYRNGFYIENQHSKIRLSKLNQQEKSLSLPLPDFSLLMDKDTFYHHFQSIIAYHKNLNSNIGYSTKNKTPYDSCGDKIILKSGEQYKVKIIEISSKEIQYKLCDNFNGPLYVINKSKVLKIIYANGYIEDIFADNKEPNYHASTTNAFDLKNKIEPPAFAPALVFSILSLLGSFTFGIGLLSLIPAMFFSRKARRQINQQPDKYKGKELMGCFMYGALITLILTTLLLLFLGIMSFVYEQDTVMSIVFLAAAFLIGLPIFIFLVTSHKNDYK